MISHPFTAYFSPCGTISNIISYLLSVSVFLSFLHNLLVEFILVCFFFPYLCYCCGIFKDHDTGRNTVFTVLHLREMRANPNTAVEYISLSLFQVYILFSFFPRNRTL